LRFCPASAHGEVGTRRRRLPSCFSELGLYVARFNGTLILVSVPTSQTLLYKMELSNILCGKIFVIPYRRDTLLPNPWWALGVSGISLDTGEGTISLDRTAILSKHTKVCDLRRGTIAHTT
jgi:hypothetical protein